MPPSTKPSVLVIASLRWSPTSNRWSSEQSDRRPICRTTSSRCRCSTRRKPSQSRRCRWFMLRRKAAVIPRYLLLLLLIFGDGFVTSFDDYLAKKIPIWWWHRDANHFSARSASCSHYMLDMRQLSRRVDLTPTLALAYAFKGSPLNSTRVERLVELLITGWFLCVNATYTYIYFMKLSSKCDSDFQDRNRSGTQRFMRNFEAQHKFRSFFFYFYILGYRICFANIFSFIAD